MLYFFTNLFLSTRKSFLNLVKKYNITSIISLGRNIVSSHIFWKFRHLFLRDWWKYNPRLNNIKKDHSFFIKMVEEYKLTSILDFGCAGASLLYEIKSINENIHTYGIDISREAIKSNKEVFSKKFSQFGFFFSDQIKKKEIERFLFINNMKYFDLIVFDRVLYCLSDSQLEDALSVLGKYGKFVFIEDFQKQYDKDKKTIGYRHRDWKKIMKSYGYKQLFCKNSIYSEVQLANAKSIFLQNENTLF